MANVVCLRRVPSTKSPPQGVSHPLSVCLSLCGHVPSCKQHNLHPTTEEVNAIARDVCLNVRDQIRSDILFAKSKYRVVITLK